MVSDLSRSASSSSVGKDLQVSGDSRPAEGSLRVQRFCLPRKPGRGLIGCCSVQWQRNDAQGSSSAIFVQRYCTGPASPRMKVMVNLSGVSLWPILMLAGSCAKLQALYCCNDMSLPLAQACLRLLPPTIKVLFLRTSLQIASDPAWYRLISLAHLHLRWFRPSELTHVQADGPCSLSSLRSLHLHAPHPLGNAIPRLEASSFKLAALTMLTFCDSPFYGRLDLTQLPALSHICVQEGSPFPKWLKSQPIGELHGFKSTQLSGVNLQRLLCSQLSFVADPGDPDFVLSDLLLMPSLTE